MSITPIIIGDSANDGNGIPLRDAFDIINNNLNFLAQQTSGVGSTIIEMSGNATLATNQIGATFRATGSAQKQLTIPSGICSAGDAIRVIVDGAGQVNIAAQDTGVTINNIAGGLVELDAAYKTLYLTCVDDDVFIASQLSAANVLEVAQALQPFSINKLVVLGASISEDMFASSTHRFAFIDVAKHMYGITINSIEERATGGWGVDTLKNNIAAILADYDGQADVVFIMHVGGNDILYGTQFNDLPAGTKAQRINDYNAILDAVEAAGHKIIPFGLTYRDSPNGVDVDPTQPKSNELGASWTYNRDWIQPIIASRYPELIRNGAMAASLYNYTRSTYDMYLHGANPSSNFNGDAVHPNELGDILAGVHYMTILLDLAQGNLPALFDEVNFNDTPPSPTIAIDVIITFYESTTTTDNNNINWIQLPYGNASNAAGYGNHFDNFIDAPINIDGTASPIAILITGGTGIYPDANVTGNDTSNSLTNTNLRRSVVYGPDLGIVGVISGLEPGATYEFSMVYRETSTAADTTFYANNRDGVGPDATTKIFTQATRADPLGRGFIRIRGESVGLAGLRIRSI